MVDLTAAEVYRDYETDGVPASGKNKPKKSLIRRLLKQYETIIGAFLADGGLIYTSRASLFADLDHGNHSSAWVVGDPTTAYNGVYMKAGVSGTGSWTRVADLPFSFIIASDEGAGTPNAIQATTSIPVSGSALVWLNIYETNLASPVTVSFNGDAPVTIKTNSGNDIAPGGVVGGMIVAGIVSGSTFRLLSDQVSSAIIAQAEAFANAALGAVPNVFPATVSDLKAVDSSTHKVAYLKLSGREGQFLFQAGDFSAEIAEDTAEGVYIKANAIAGSAGAWVRQYSGQLRPEWFGAVGDNSLDCGPAFRRMFALGLFLGVPTFVGTPGAIYRFASPDPADVNEAYAVTVLGVTSDLYLNFSGSQFVLTDDIRSPAADALGTPGTLFRFESAFLGEATADGQKIHISGGFYDSQLVTASTNSVQTVGVYSVVGNWNVICENATFFHGLNAPSGEDVGVGGGDQSFFLSGYSTASFVNCDFIGAPDLAIYASNSVGKYIRVIGCRFYGNKNAIGIKRFSGYYIILGSIFERGDIGVYEPVSDGLTTNNGGIGIIANSIFRKIQTRPIDISARSDRTRVTGCIIEDFGRRYSDGAELAAVEQISGVRVRAWWVDVSDNWIGLKDWTLGTTAGKEQVGVTFGYDGNHAKGATDCMADDNTFFGLYRRIVYQTNTAGNLQRNNKGINISQQDSDSGQNHLPIQLADGAATSILMPSNRCIVCIESQATTAGFPNGLMWVNTTGAPAAPTPIGFITTTNISFATGALSAGGGVASNLTLSAHSDGRLYIANRTGGAKQIKISVIDR